MLVAYGICLSPFISQVSQGSLNIWMYLVLYLVAQLYIVCTVPTSIEQLYYVVWNTDRPCVRILYSDDNCQWLHPNFGNVKLMYSTLSGSTVCTPLTVWHYYNNSLKI